MMTTQFTWPLVCTIFITLGLSWTAPQNTTMPLTLEQAQAAIALYEKYHMLKAECEAKGLTLQQGLSPELKAQVKEGNVLLKKYYKEAVTLVKNQEEIDCSTFSNAVLQWRADIETFFEGLKKSHAQVNIEVEQFRAKLARRQSTFPLVQDLYQEWQDLLGSLEAEVTGATLFQALLGNSATSWQLTSNLKAIEQHYKQNKKEYKKYENSMESFRDEAMPKEQYFQDALDASTSEEDPNLPENVEEEAADKKEELKQIEQNYKLWLDKNLEALNEIDTTEEGQVINKNLLSTHRSTEMLAPPYAQGFWEATGAAIEQAILAEEGTVAYKKASKIAIRILGQKYQEYVTQEFLQAGIKSNDPSSPLGLQDWLKASIENNKGELEKFLSQWQDWCQANSNVVALCENKMMGKTYTIDPQKLEKEMTTAFTYTVNGTHPGLDIWKKLQAHLPQGKASFDQLLTAWQNGISALLEEEFAKGLWSQHLTGGQGNENLEQAIAQFFAKAPSPEKLVNALWDARYHAPQANMPVPKDTLHAFFKIEDGAVKHYSFALPIPLSIQAKQMPNGHTQHYAFPNLTGLTVGDLVNQGGNSYRIDALHSLKALETKITVEGHVLKASTMVSFKLSVTDSMEMTMVTPAKKGSLDIINLNLDQIIGIKKKIGTDLFGGKTMNIALCLVGDEKGNLGEIQATGTVAGFDVTFHMGKEGWYIKTKNPVALKKAIKQATEGSTNYDIFFSVEIYSEHLGDFHYVHARNGQQGKVELDGRGSTFVKGRDSLKVTHNKDKIMVPIVK